MNWTRGFSAARAASLNSVAPRHARRVGAALFSGSVILSIGHNTYSHGHPKALKLGNIHAEHRALLRRQHYDPRGNLVLYVYRETADGRQANSRPCDNCLELMKEAGVRIVRFIDIHRKPCELKIA